MKEGILNQYRDWLIPVSLFTAISAANFIFIISVTKLTDLLIVAASLSIISIMFFIVNLLLAFTKLEQIEVYNKNAKKSSGLFRTAILGILTFCGSLCILSFWKSMQLGYIVCTIFFVMLLILFFTLYDALKNK